MRLKQFNPKNASSDRKNHLGFILNILKIKNSDLKSENKEIM